MDNFKKIKSKRDNIPIPGTDYAPNSDFWYGWRKTIVGILLCVLLAITTFFGSQTVTPSQMKHGFIGLSVKPGAIYNEELDGWDYSTAYRTITLNPSTITNEEDVKELAYALYQMGNIGMMISPQSGYFSEGNSDAMTMGSVLPLFFQTVDIRDNENGEAYRIRNQSLNGDVDPTDPVIIIFGNAGGVVNSERRYHKVGLENDPIINYEKTLGNGLVAEYDWSKKIDNKSLEDRYDRSVNPIPFTASAILNGDTSVLGKKYGVFEMEYTYLKDFDSLASLKIGAQDYQDIFGDVGNVIIPIYKDCFDFRAEGDIYTGVSMGRTISYEKTDQHIFYSKDATMSVYNTIKTASVSYVSESSSGANDGYYKVSIELDCSVDEDTYNNYTSADTCWALRDSQASGSRKADFTKIIIDFELWDNGFFKSWDMIENWFVDNAKRGALNMGEMGAEQKYHEEFTYRRDELILTGSDRDYWSK